MSQPDSLTTAQLQAYSDQLANGSLADIELVIEMFSDSARALTMV